MIKVSRNILHYVKFVGLALVIAMIWLTARRPSHEPRYPNGQPKATGSFTNGKAEGTWTWWYADGSKMTEGIFVDGKRNGTWNTWFSDGTKKSEARYKGDRLNGLYTSWHQNGTIEQVGNFMEDKPEGVHYFYDTTGRLIESKIYTEGKIVDTRESETDNKKQ